MCQRVNDGANQLKETGSFQEPARAKLVETRKAITHGWLDVDDALDAQGKVSLAEEARHFARHLPRVLTDKERLAVTLVRHVANTRLMPRSEIAGDKGDELTR